VNAQSLGTLLLLGGLAAVVWLLHKLGRALEALAALVVALLALWLVVKTAYFMIKAAVTHWRTTLGVLVLGICLWWWGSLPVVLAVVAVTVALGVWRWQHPATFEAWVGRRLRSWWLRWTIYGRRLPLWLRACGLTVRDPNEPVVVVTPFGRRGMRRQQRPGAACAAGALRCLVG
jgi:DNA segregation ATPase FtsK/SpoIIIE, S-DNA-T family